MQDRLTVNLAPGQDPG